MNSLSKKMFMYYQIQNLVAEKLSISQISQKLDLNWRTIKKYLQFSEQEYLDFIEKEKFRVKELEPYTDFIKSRLEKYPETSAAQIHDLLKEKHADFPGVSQKTVYNFTIWIRQKYNLPKIDSFRDFSPVEQLPYGEYSQVDWGVYTMQNAQGVRQKVWFFCMSLSRSRYKFVFFSPVHFTTQTTIEAHEKAFEYFNGISKTIVYDQDKLLIVNENMGDYLLTALFKKYSGERKFLLHFCRKADPQSKGKIENIVKYVKQNFLYGRVFSDTETLNYQALKWLERTANALPHGTTKKIPAQEWLIEKQTLQSYTAMILPPAELPCYVVRKDNTISFRANFYTLPLNTYNGRNTKVRLGRSDNELIIYTLEMTEIARHQIPQTKGNTVSNTNHKRDTSGTIDELITQLALLFSAVDTARQWLNQIRITYPRYIRDHLLLIKKEIEIADASVVNTTLDFCIKNNLYSGNDFKDVLSANSLKMNTVNKEIQTIKPITNGNLPTQDLIPEKSDIQVYQQLIN